MRNTMILTATLALVLTLAFASTTASAAPYVKGNAPQIQNESQTTPASAVQDAKSGGVAFTARPSLGIENGSGAVVLTQERPHTNSGTPGQAASTNAVKAERPNYGIENGSGAYK